MDSYKNRLEETKTHYPFAEWRKNGEEFGMEQYTEEACAKFVAIFDQLIEQLVALGRDGGEPEKLTAFQKAIEATNYANDEDPSLIETGEREELCELCNLIASAAGLDPSKYGDGEGPASEWRDW